MPRIGINNNEVLHLAFSHHNLLACVSSINRNLLSIWDYVKAERICEARLNFVCPDIFDFCVINQNLLIGATERSIYVWTIEPYGRRHHLSCKHTAVPRLDAMPGFYEEPEDNSPIELIAKDENPNQYPPVREVVTGMFTRLLHNHFKQGVLAGGADEYRNYQDSDKRVKPHTLTWTKDGYAIFGCKTGHIFMVS